MMNQPYVVPQKEAFEFGVFFQYVALVISSIRPCTHFLCRWDVGIICNYNFVVSVRHFILKAQDTFCVMITLFHICVTLKCSVSILIYSVSPYHTALQRHVNNSFITSAAIEHQLYSLSLRVISTANTVTEMLSLLDLMSLRTAEFNSF